MTKPKFKIPKIKLAAALWVVFAIVILIEGLVLYRALFAPPGAAPPAVSEVEAEVNIDPAQLTQLQSWLQAHEGALPAAATPNPFAEYR